MGAPLCAPAASTTRMARQASHRTAWTSPSPAVMRLQRRAGAADARVHRRSRHDRARSKSVSSTGVPGAPGTIEAKAASMTSTTMSAGRRTPRERRARFEGHRRCPRACSWRSHARPVRRATRRARARYHDYAEMVDLPSGDRGRRIRTSSGSSRSARPYQGRRIWAAEVCDTVGRATKASPRSCSTGSTTLGSTSAPRWPCTSLRTARRPLRPGQPRWVAASRASSTPGASGSSSMVNPDGLQSRPAGRPGHFRAGARTASRTAAASPSAPTSTATTTTCGGGRPPTGSPEQRTAAGGRSRRPRPAPSATSCSAASSAGGSASGPTSRSTPRVSTSCGPTATPTRDDAPRT